MNLIAAVDAGWGIGYQNDLLVKIPQDLKYFKEKTLGKTVIMGRATFDSLPNRKPLKDRKNIVLTTRHDFEPEGVKVFHNLAEFFESLKGKNTEDIFVIGGADIYRQLLPFCSYAFITKIQNTYPADKFLVNLDSLTEWEKIYESPYYQFTDHTQKTVNFSFITYKNQHVLSM